MKTIALRALLSVLSLYLLSADSSAQILPSYLHGYVEVAAVQAEIDGVQRDTVTQQYNLAFDKRIAGNMQLRVAGRYSKFDLESPELTGALREEIQPSADFFWKHPHFLFTTSAFRRELQLLSLDGRLITDDAQVSLRNRNPDHPSILLRYGWQEISDEGRSAGSGTRDSRDRRLQASIREEFDWQDIHYSFTRRLSENHISGLDVTQNAHIFRWSAARTPLDTDRLSLLANYTFNRRSQRDEFTSDGQAIEPISVIAGLYARDPSPDVGALEELDGLNDAVVETGTEPPIDIGGGNQDQNIGVDLGFERPSSAIYVYVDRVSGDDLGWTVYRSDDNLNWSLAAAAPMQRFNAGLRRYEIEYRELTARYVKVVSSGINEVTQVLVSEIGIFAPVAERPGSERTRTAHLADFRSRYEFSERWDGSLDLSYRHEPSQGGVGQRRNTDVALRASFDQNELLTHHFRAEEAFQRFDEDRDRIRDDVLGYTLFIDPLPTVAATAAANSRFEKIGGSRSREIHTILGELRGDPLQGLTLSSGLTANRAFFYQNDLRSDTWIYRVTARGAVTKALDASLGWSHQQTTSQPGDRLRVRSTITAGFNLRLTRTIFLQGDINDINDVGDNSTQRYLISWRLAPSLRVSGQATLNGFDAGKRTEQYSANLTYDINTRSTLFFRYSSVDFSEAGGNETDSFQQGFRTAL